jgi:hypothetical protein
MTYGLGALGAYKCKTCPKFSAHIEFTTIKTLLAQGAREWLSALGKFRRGIRPTLWVSFPQNPSKYIGCWVNPRRGAHLYSTRKELRLT